MTTNGSNARNRWGQVRFDGSLAFGLGAIFVPVTAYLADDWAPDDRSVDRAATLLVAVAFSALALRRKAPIVTLGVVVVATTLYLWSSYPYGPVLGAFFIAVYTVAVELPIRTAAVAAGLAMAVMLTHVLGHPTALGGWLGLIPGAAWAVVPFALGISVRTTRESRRTAQDDALRRHLSNERMQLAQEVHDVVGHGLAAIQLQADIALHVDESQPPRTRQALESISAASKAAIAELAIALEVIEPGRSGTPGIEDIEALCDRTRNAGVELELSLAKRTDKQDDQAGLAAYRVVQEALTNVIRHGEVPRAVVMVEVDDEEIRIRVTNPGLSARAAVQGRGLRGMRRRVEGLGGSFNSGPTGHGFEVDARIPLRTAA